MIIIESKRKKPATILKKYPEAILADVTSQADSRLRELSPFFPHYDIPVPFRRSRFSPGLRSRDQEYLYPVICDLQDVRKISQVRNTAACNICIPFLHREGIQEEDLTSLPDDIQS